MKCKGEKILGRYGHKGKYVRGDRGSSRYGCKEKGARLEYKEKLGQWEKGPQGEKVIGRKGPITALTNIHLHAIVLIYWLSTYELLLFNDTLPHFGIQTLRIVTFCRYGCWWLRRRNIFEILEVYYLPRHPLLFLTTKASWLMAIETIYGVCCVLVLIIWWPPR